MRALAVELGDQGIAANAIAPGFFLTERNAPFFSQPRIAELARRIPLRRFGRPDEIVGAAIFLASDAASYVTGQVLTVDAGLSIALYRRALRAHGLSNSDRSTASPIVL